MVSIIKVKFMFMRIASARCLVLLSVCALPTVAWAQATQPSPLVPQPVAPGGPTVAPAPPPAPAVPPAAPAGAPAAPAGAAAAPAGAPGPAPRSPRVDVDAPLDPAEPLTARAAAPAPGDPEEILNPAFASPGAGADAAVGTRAVRAGAGRETFEGLADPGAHLLSLPNLHGPIGLLRLSTADTAGAGHLRLGFHGEYFSGSSVLVTDDRNVRLQGSLTVGYTPIPHLDLFGAFLGGSNRNRRVCNAAGCTSEPDRTDPELIRTFGDLILGAKYAKPVARGFSAGGELALRMMSAISGLSVDPSATSVSMRGIGSIDFREFGTVPLRMHLNLGYYVDRSGVLQDYAGVSEASKLVSSFAYGIARSRFRSALAIDVPLPPVGRDVFVHPFAEYHLEVVTGGVDKRFERFAAPLCGIGNQACVDNRDQQWLSLGVRTLVGGAFSIDFAVDIGFRSVGFPYGTPQAPYNIVLGGTLPLDLGMWGKTRMVTRTVTVDKAVPPPPAEGVVAGAVVNASDATPIAGAIVAVAGRAQSRVASDPDGAFVSHPLPAGEVNLEISASGFDSQVVRAEIAAGMSTDVRVALTPKVTAIKVTGRLSDGKGGAVVGTVRFIGAITVTGSADADGRFSVDIEPGSYVVRAGADRHLSKEIHLTVRDGSPAVADFSLRRRPATPSVRVSGKGLIAARPIRFRVVDGKPTDQLTVASQSVLDEVVDILIGDPAIARIDVEVHWDSGIGRDPALAITTRQAESIADYLRGQGIAPDRVRTDPKGASQPLVPNIGSKNRLKNQRVKFRIARA